MRLFLLGNDDVMALCLPVAGEERGGRGCLPVNVCVYVYVLERETLLAKVVIHIEREMHASEIFAVMPSSVCIRTWKGSLSPSLPPLFLDRWTQGHMPSLCGCPFLSDLYYTYTYTH